MKIIKIGTCSECPHITDDTPLPFKCKVAGRSFGGKELPLPEWCPLDDDGDATDD